MRDVQRRLLILILATLPAPVIGWADSGSTVDENRQLLEQWRRDPQRLARLKRNQAAFRKLPPAEQERLRKLDRDLGEESPAMRKRLEGVMVRYHAWLEALPEEQRRSIENAPDRKTRLELIRKLRQQEWLKRLPKTQQDQIAQARGPQQNELIQQFLQQALEDQADWQVAERFGGKPLPEAKLPTRLAMLPKDAQIYVERNLLPLLSPEDEKRLQNAEGKWPRYLRVLVELADNYPTSVLGPVGPVYVRRPLEKPYAEDLYSHAKRLAEMLDDKEKMIGPLRPLRTKLEQAKGKWPEFGVVLREMEGQLPKKIEKRLFPLTPEFTPARPKDFPAPVQVFIEKRLLPALSDTELKELTQAEGHWPKYPRLVVELARKHNLPVPAESLPPGPIDWDRYRIRPR